MSYRLPAVRGLSRGVRVVVVVALLAVAVASSAWATGGPQVVRRYGDAGGRLISITDFGSVIEFFTSPTSEHIFSGNVQEGFMVSYDDDRIAWSVHDDTRNINPRAVASNLPSGVYPNGTAIAVSVLTTTWDNRLFIQTNFAWTAGTSVVGVQTLFGNNQTSGNVLIKTMKRFVDVNVDRNPLNSFATSSGLRADAFIPGGNRFIMEAAGVTVTPGSPVVVRRNAYHADATDADFAVPDSRNAETGATSNENDVLVVFDDRRETPGGGHALAPNSFIPLTVFYGVIR